MSADPTQSRTISVVIVDDHQVLTDALAVILRSQPDLRVVDVAATCAAARDLLSRTCPDVLLLDVSLPDGDGLSLVPDVNRMCSEAHILVLTSHSDEKTLMRAVETGVTGFVMKNRPLSEVISAIRSAAEGEIVMPASQLMGLLGRAQQTRARPPAERGSASLTSREQEILTYLARVQGVGADGPPGTPSVFEGAEDPWSVPAGRAGGLLIRAKCAPHFRRILWQLDPRSPLLANYAHGSCPAGKYYCRITPDGDVTPCPYMPVSAGNLRQAGFAELWERGQVFADLREPRLGGRCGACEFQLICGGCRCRAYATFGDYLAEDPACAYEPGRYGGEVLRLPAEQTFGLEARLTLPWEPAARARLDAIPAFARGMVVQAVEAYARSQGQATITPALMAEVRSRWGINPERPFTPRTG